MFFNAGCVSTLSRPKAAAQGHHNGGFVSVVSTLSRPKAAVVRFASYPFKSWFQHSAARRRLLLRFFRRQPKQMFQHSAARRRLSPKTSISSPNWGFNTQPPEGGWPIARLQALCIIKFQHSAARRRLIFINDISKHIKVSTLSRPKAAGFPIHHCTVNNGVSTLSRPKAAA